MKAPGFWYRERPGAAGFLLWPLTLFWRLGGAVRARRLRPRRAPVPVICVGNLTAGGAGKTPTVAAWAARLADGGRRVAIVGRGHGGRVVGPHRVDPDRDAAAGVGDEALLLARTVPAAVWVARDRAAGAEAAARAGARLVLLDDGFQNPGLIADASVLVVDAGAGFGNGRLIPAGPLREPLVGGLARADLVLLIGEPEQRRRAVARWPQLAGAAPARLAPKPDAGFPAGPVVAFAGIGRPQKFFDTLRGMGADLVATYAFPDHHPYSERTAARILREAERRGARAATTEKDAVRLPAGLRGKAAVLPVRLEPEDWSPLDALADRLLGAPLG